MGKWPSLAYYWPTDSLISAQDAIKKRERNDLRTGDIHCHADCYKRTPRTGHTLFARKGPGSPHFWIGTGNFIKDSNCKFERIMRNRSESYRFSQFFHDLIEWFENEKEEVQGIFRIKSWDQSTSKSSDINIVHNKSENIDWKFTDITIVDKNRKRVQTNESTLLIDISQWPDSHLLEFSKYGKRKVIEEWERLIAKNEEKRTEKEAELSKRRRNFQHQRENRSELMKGVNELKKKSNLFEKQGKKFPQFLSTKLNNQPNSLAEAEKQIEMFDEFLSDAREHEWEWYMAVLSDGKHQFRVDVSLKQDFLPDRDSKELDLKEEFFAVTGWDAEDTHSGYLDLTECGLSGDFQNVFLSFPYGNEFFSLRKNVVIPSAKLAAETKRKLVKIRQKLWKKENPNLVNRIKRTIERLEERLQEKRDKLLETKRIFSKLVPGETDLGYYLVTEMALSDLPREIFRIEKQIREQKDKIR